MIFKNLSVAILNQPTDIIQCNTIYTRTRIFANQWFQYPSDLCFNCTDSPMHSFHTLSTQFVRNQELESVISCILSNDTHSLCT